MVKWVTTDQSKARTALLQKELQRLRVRCLWERWTWLVASLPREGCLFANMTDCETKAA